MFFFFFQAEDGIRDYKVTGVQTCALPIWLVVDARVDDARVVAGLVRGETRLLLEDHEARPGEALAQRPRRGEADDAAADDRDVVGQGGLRYCIGEKVVGFQILLTTRSTSGPFASVTFRAACHSGSAMNADHARWRWGRSSYAQM